MIRQWKTKIKEQEHSINELSSAVELFLKIQAIVKQPVARKIKVTVSNIDLKIVKPFIRKVCGHLKRQPDHVKYGTDKNSQCHYTIKDPKTSEKKSCKH